MNKVIVACNTLADELKTAVLETCREYPILWVESGLHNSPQLLKEKLQQVLDTVDRVDCVLLAFGFCGNSVLGIKAREYRLVIPRVEDCITLLLGSDEKRKEASGTYFLTRGWLDYEKNIWEEYKFLVKKYGKERAERVFQVMLGHYKNLGLIDTGAYSLEDVQKISCRVARDLKLHHIVIEGTLDYMKKLLTGPYDEDFIIVPPGEEVTFDTLYGA